MRTFCLGIVALLLVGCASYLPPGLCADMRLFTAPEADPRAPLTEPDIQAALSRQPLAALPAGIAVTRVQAPGYRSESARSFGHGRYSVVTVRDVEKDEDFDRLARLPQVARVDSVNRLLLPEKLESSREIREAAANLHADFLLVYTFDTQFRTEDLATPLTVISLGLFPTKNARVDSTASAVLLDTRNGYVYGTAAASARTTQLANAWTSGTAVDQSRRRAEREAFEALLADIERAWSREVAARAPAAPGVPAADGTAFRRPPR